MRVDVNLSVREAGAKELGIRTEMENLNSFRAISRAIEGECKRQIELIEAGEKVTMETRRWDDKEDRSYSMRSKEDAQDYRYFPEPDLVPIVISDEWIESIKANQPELRDEKRSRYKAEYDIPDYDIDIITSSKKMADIFEETIVLGCKPKEVSNWLMVETMRLLKEQNEEPEAIKFSPENLAKLIRLVESGKINRTIAKEVFEVVFAENINPEAYVEEKGLGMVSNENELRSVIEEVLAQNPQSVQDYHNGKTKAMGFIVGQTMRAMKGKADPGAVNRLVEEMLIL